MRLKTLYSTSLLLALVACGGVDSPPTTSPPTTSAAEAASAPAMSTASHGHGNSVELGSLTLAGGAFSVLRFGDIEPNKEIAFEVIPPTDRGDVNAYLWLESKAGAQVCTTVKGSPEGDRLHFHLMPDVDDEPPFRVVLRIRSSEGDERGSLPLDGHGHEHVEGPHSGVPAKMVGPGGTRHLELKLHDDKGDLELWLAEDPLYQQPFDLPVDATIEVEFIDFDGRKLALRPRNTVENEDEDGAGNMREGKTNYFIFPSREGVDASWLQGLSFQSIVIVTISDGTQRLTSEEFVLKPHSH